MLFPPIILKSDQLCSRGLLHLWISIPALCQLSYTDLHRQRDSNPQHTLLLYTTELPG